MTARKRHEQAAESIFHVVALSDDDPQVRAADRPDDASDAYMTILGFASECDRIERQLADDAATMAARFRDYAQSVLAGRPSSPLTAYSMMRDIDSRSVELKEKRDALLSLIRVVLGKEAWRKFRDALNASYAEAPR